jgi:exosome complex RNA-binding protein Rrp42 (RNase PH superfamily)
MQKGGMQPYSQNEIKETMEEAKNQIEKLREVLEEAEE